MAHKIKNFLNIVVHYFQMNKTIYYNNYTLYYYNYPGTNWISFEFSKILAEPIAFVINRQWYDTFKEIREIKSNKIHYLVYLKMKISPERNWSGFSAVDSI